MSERTLADIDKDLRMARSSVDMARARVAGGSQRHVRLLHEAEEKAKKLTEERNTFLRTHKA